MRWMRRLLPALAVLLFASSVASADGRQLEIHFTPTERMQYALWITSADGSIFQTIRLTDSVGRYGIGNRPGASQMNSGFRWPYGRRENVLPIWAYGRVAAGGTPFRRVIFQDRTSEGWASRSSNDSTRDDYFCLSFDSSTTRREALDAVTCASVFMSDKGRFMAATDVDTPFGQEPFELRPAAGMMRPLEITSLYPPRRDLADTCRPEDCDNHPDIFSINDEAERVMPDIDAISRATPSEGVPYRVTFDVPDAWPDGEYFLWLEANVEGDYNESYNETTLPTPTTPDDKWDYWAVAYGYPYRGQPSVVYRLPVTLDGFGGTYQTGEAYGYSDVNGADGDIRPMDATIDDDHAGSPGSGADRLLADGSGNRITVEIPPSNICSRPSPPPECMMECGATSPCPDGFICGEEGMCVGLCDIFLPPAIVADVALEQHPDVKHAHHWAQLSFVVPSSQRTLDRFEIRVSNRPIVDDATFMDAQGARVASLDSEDLVIDVTGLSAGDTVNTEIGQLMPETHYWVAVRAIDECNDAGSLGVAEITTAKIHFTTVSPCFVATAAYGSPMADEIRALRRFRDRHLRSNAPGRAFVSAYESVGPYLAGAIRQNDTLRAAARLVLAPYVAVASALDD